MRAARNCGFFIFNRFLQKLIAAMVAAFSTFTKNKLQNTCKLQSRNISLTRQINKNAKNKHRRFNFSQRICPFFGHKYAANLPNFAEHKGKR